MLVACAAVTVAAVLPSVLPRLSRPAGRHARHLGNAQLAEQTLSEQGDEVHILLRREDCLPVYAVGRMEMLGVTLGQLRDDLACLLEQLKDAKQGKAYWEHYQSWDGSAVLSAEMEWMNGMWFCIMAHRCADGQNDLFTFRDVTALHERESTFQAQLDRAEEASQFKTSFLFRMSHEIRTPINGITGTLKLAEDHLPKHHPAMEYLSKTDELSGHLLALVNDILDMARIEAGKVELEQAPFSLRALGDKLYNMYARQLKEKNIHYAVNFEDMTVDWVQGDELRISQIILNFLSNAVKFTSQGEIAVTFRQMLLKDSKADLMVCVHDTGIGMKPEFIERIFQPFEQEDASTTRRFGGTGLGMTITDHLVHLMGGQIVVNSLPGQGSDFSVFLSLPIADVPAESQSEKPVLPAETEQTPEVQSLDGMRILMHSINHIS